MRLWRGTYAAFGKNENGINAQTLQIELAGAGGGPQAARQRRAGGRRARGVLAAARSRAPKFGLQAHSRHRAVRAVSAAS